MDDINPQLESITAIPNQKDRTTAYLTLLAALLSPTPKSSIKLISLGQHLTTTSSMAMVVGRRVLGAFVKALCAGSGMESSALGSAKGVTASGASGGGGGGGMTEDMAESADDDGGVGGDWDAKGRAAFEGENGEEIRREVVEGVLSSQGMGGWCDEQTTTLRHLLSHILASEEDWLGAAQALMRIPLEGGSRLISDQEKLSVYIQIVRLLLECGESGSAQTYFSRASLLIHTTTDKETLLIYRLSQARLFDYSARFNEAAQKYHELSFDSSIDETERMMMLKAAVTAALLAPSGPLRSRILASLNRDDRIQTHLPPYLSTMLRKMLLEYILRSEEVQDFEKSLGDHQRAKVEGGGTLLERAVREHNVAACGKVYDNIGFDGLGALLDLDPESAETMARRMIEQGRLRAWIDQPLHLLYFESRETHDTDADAQGTAGGLGVVKEEKEIEGVTWTERWDDRIRATSIKVESIAAAIQQKGLIPLSTASTSVRV